MKSKMKFSRFLNRHVSVVFALAAVFAAVSSAVSCSFFKSFDDEENSASVTITSLTVGKTALSMKVGSMDYVSVSIKPAAEQKNVKLKWSYDSSIVECDTSSNWGVTVKGLAEGQTSLKCSYDGYDATCLVTVSGYEENYETTVEPYIYSNTTTLQTSLGVTEKVFVSLYGGNAGDIDGYTWTIDNASVASIQPTGQYCFVTAKDSGYARIKVTHSKAAYPYYMGIYVFADATNVTYITTDSNILTMNADDGERTFSVSLVNAKETSLASNFSWEILKDSQDTPVSLQYNGNSAVVSPLSDGSCTIRVTHPDAPYPLDILCRVITVVKNVYIKPDRTSVNLEGDAEQSVISSLENIDMGGYSIDDYSYAVENYDVAEITASIGNQVFVKGKANGSTKLIVSHPKSLYSREVLLIVTGQMTDAVDASGYITTSQNYIRTKVGAETSKISVSLKGGIDGDENGFVWSVSDGASGVISLETPHGTVGAARTVSSNYVLGNAYITPEAEGTAVISISHPKIVYPTEILVKVLSEDAVLEEPLYFTGGGILRILNGESAAYTVSLRGKNKTDSDDSGIVWTCDGSTLSIAPAGNTVNVTAPPGGSGNTVSHLTARHSKADNEKTVLVLTADTEEELNDMKALYSDKLYYNFGVNDEVRVTCSHAGFDGYSEDSDEEIKEYDFSRFTWTVSDPDVISVEKNGAYPLECTVKGLKSGRTKLKGSITDSGTVYSCEWTMTVYPEGAVQTEPEIYFTTAQNVVTLSGEGRTADVSVTPVRLPAGKYSEIEWETDGQDIVNVIPNGNSATFTALSEGEAVVRVSHPESQNTLKIYVRVGSEYVIPERKPAVHISSQDVLTMLRDDQAQKLQAVLVNYSDSGTSSGGFSFSIDNENVAVVYAQSDEGIAYIKPVSSGQAEITITNPKSEVSKKVLVIVGNSAEELAAFTYLTTAGNVVAIGEGNSKSVSVSVKNSESIVVGGFSWSSSDPSVASVVSSGATAVLKGNKIGTATVTVRNSLCKYPLQIIVQVVDPVAAAENPFIHLTSSVMTLTCGASYTSISADLVGGTDSDKSGFFWSSEDSKIAAVYGQNEVGKVRALQAGTTHITVSHPKAAYPAQILVVCDEAKKSECSISVPSSIISMKPTDATQTVTVTLVNGSATDRYNFSWSLDVYDIIDFQYSANVCTITPKQTGSVTITISHPKAAYPQQIIVNVQQYSTFAFPDESMTVTQGDVKFISMQIPNTNVATHVEYSVDNSAICSITGTKTTAQITACGSGTTIVRARLIASGTGVEQAAGEMMVYVKEREVDAVYITSSSTVTTLNKGKSQTLSATLTGTGVVTSDQYNLKWTTSDSDIVQVTGISSDGYVRGQSIYITALKSGEAVITCSHEKAASALQFYVVVPGSAEKVITLNKNFIKLVKGSSGVTLKADIENKESSNDYNNIVWSCANVIDNGGDAVCRIMGSGQAVTVYPLSVGEAEVMAQLPDSGSVAKCTVTVEAAKSFTFEQASARIQPFAAKKVKYTVSPPSAERSWTWTSNSGDDDFFKYNDLGCDEKGVGFVEIEGLKEGSGVLYCITDGAAKDSLTVRVTWDYSFTMNKTRLQGRPDRSYEIKLSVNPANTELLTDDCNIADIDVVNNGDGTAVMTVTPKKEGSDTVTITAKNAATKEEYASKTLALDFKYESLTVLPKVVSKKGSFSRYDGASGMLFIGDGEEVELGFDVAEQNAGWEISGVKCEPVEAGSPVAYKVGQKETSSGGGTYIVYHPDDTVTQQYRIVEGYVPVYKDQYYRDDEWFDTDNDGEDDYCVPGEWVLRGEYDCDLSDFEWGGYEYAHKVLVSTEYDDTYGLFHKKRSNQNPGGYMNEDSSAKWVVWWDDKYYKNEKAIGSYFGRRRYEPLDGTIMTQKDFEATAWYYSPGATYGTGQLVYVPEGVIIEHINAVKEECTDTAVQDCRLTDYFTITVVRQSGKTQTHRIPVYTEVRNCKSDFKN